METGKKKLLNKNNTMTKTEIEWPMIEVRATYKVTENWAEYEGHGRHLVDEGERELTNLELYIAGETIDIMDKLPQIIKHINL